MMKLPKYVLDLVDKFRITGVKATEAMGITHVTFRKNKKTTQETVSTKRTIKVRLSKFHKRKSKGVGLNYFSIKKKSEIIK